MLRDRDVIHLSLDNYWNGDPRSRFHLTALFWEHGNRVFWINTFGMRIPKLSKQGTLSKILGKLWSYRRTLQRVKEGFWVFTPVAVPIGRSELLGRLHDLFLLFQLRLLMLCFHIRRPIVFATTPMYGRIIGRLRGKPTIYYYSDDYAAYREIKHKRKIEQLDMLTLAAADHVFCASLAITERVSKRGRQAHYLPHGVNFKLFNGALTTERAKPWDLAGIPKPIIGYFGSLTDSNDIELIEYLALSRPNYSIVLIGSATSDYDRLKTIPNIYLLGQKRHAEVPYYGKHFDVCFMGWKNTEWIERCSPLKTMEYLALGKPVVSLPIRELTSAYQDVVEVASNKQEFVKLVDYSLRSDSLERRTERVEFVRHQTWEDRFNWMIETATSITGDGSRSVFEAHNEQSGNGRDKAVG